MLGIVLRPIVFLLKLPFLVGKASKPALERVANREGFTYGETRKEGDRTIVPLGHHPAGGEFELLADLEVTSEYICLRPVNGWTQGALAILGVLVPDAARFLPGREREEKPALQDAEETPQPDAQSDAQPDAQSDAQSGARD